MSIQTPNGDKANESTNSPHVLTLDQYERRQENYGQLVAAVADDRDVTAGKAKRIISDVGRSEARQQDQQ